MTTALLHRETAPVEPLKARRRRNVPRIQELTYLLARRGNCAGKSILWGQAEGAVQDAMRQGNTLAVVHLTEPLFMMCSNCPVRMRCQEWADLDCYSGIAAGEILRDGKPEIWFERECAA